MTDGLRKSHLRKTYQVGISEVGHPEGSQQCDYLISFIPQTYPDVYHVAIWMLHHRGDFHKNVPQNHFQCCQTEGLRFQLGNPKNSIVVHRYLLGFRISLSLWRKGTIFRDEIENYCSCSHLARRDGDYHKTILVFRDENEITYIYSHVSRGRAR